MPMVDRLTEEAHATGAVNTITREGKRLDRPQHGRARLPGRARPARRQAEDAAPGGRARAPAAARGPWSTASSREGFQRIVVFNRHLHRAEGLVKHFGRSAAHMELRAMPWHESIIEAELAKAEGPGQRDVDRADQRREPDPGRGPPRRTCWCST